MRRAAAPRTPGTSLRLPMPISPSHPDPSEPLPDAAPSLGWRRRLLFSGAALVLSLLLVAGAGEVLVRLLVPPETFWPVGNIYQPSEMPGVLYTYRPDFEGTAFGVGLKTNSLGFRGPEWAVQKPVGVFRIALIGDSYAFGFGVPYEQTVGEQLADHLEARIGRPVEVLNFGVNGYNSHQQQAVLDQLAMGYDPDLVLLLPTSNDHKAPLRADADGWLHWDGDDQNERSRMRDKSIERTAPAAASWFMQHSRLVLYLQMMRQRWQLQQEAQRQRPAEAPAPDARWMAPVEPGPPSERLAETVYAPLQRMIGRARSAGQPVVIACFCGPADYRRMLPSLARDDRVAVLELLTFFPEARSWEELTAMFGLGWDDHLNAVAHSRWGAALGDLIVAHGFAAGPEAAAPTEGF